MRKALIFVFAFFSLFAIFVILYFTSSEENKEICNPCEINNCVCKITYCEKGIAEIYNNSKCARIPLYAFSFSSNKIIWKPNKKGAYYLKLLCEDREFSTCIPITVS